jgi:serine/threonine protein kinase/formylglycine-generating enzyme required for sulfatase activity
LSATDEGGSLGKPVRDILQILSTIPLLSAEELAALGAKWTGARLDEDGSVLARELVKQGKVTKYQAAALYQGQPKGLAVADYLFLDRLGSGGTGTVYKARLRGSGDLVAVKVLNSASVRSPAAVKRFQREADIAIRLNHPNITRALEAGEADGRRYMVMELLEGVDLSSYAKKKGTLPAEEAVRYVADAARGLAYAHEQGIVHRDVKPGNLLRLSDGRIKVLDLGLARLADPDGAADDEGLTQTGVVMGTIDYMAPEQALATHNADARADIYGLGCTLYRLVAGDIPFPGDSLVAKILAHRDSPIPSLRAKFPKTPAAVDYVLARMLAKRPENRYQTMQELVGDLELSISPQAGRLLPPAPDIAPPQRSAPSATVPQLTPVPELTPVSPDPPALTPVLMPLSGAEAASNSDSFPLLMAAVPVVDDESSMHAPATPNLRPVGRVRWPAAVITAVGTCATMLVLLTWFGGEETPPPPSRPLTAASTGSGDPTSSSTASPTPSPPNGGSPSATAVVAAPLATALASSSPPPPVATATATQASAPPPPAPTPPAPTAAAPPVPSPSVPNNLPAVPSARPSGTALASIGPAPVPIGLPAVDIRPDPGYLKADASNIGQVWYFEVVGADKGRCWGTDVYTTDSSLTAAAVHSGVLKLGEMGVVKVTIMPGQASYPATTRYGISSASWGSWGVSFKVERADAVSRAAVVETRSPAAEKRLAVPAEADLAQALKIIRGNSFTTEYAAAKTPEARVRLAELLMAKARELLDDPARRYVLLCEARDLAAEGGGALAAADAATRAAAEFLVEENTWLADGVERAVNANPSPVVARQIAVLALWKLDAAIVAGELGAAERLAACLATATRRGLDQSLSRFTADRQKQVATVIAARQSAVKNRAALDADPNDPAANLAEGKRLALDERNWQEAFPYLAKGSDATLRDLGEKSLAAPVGIDARLALGDLWWSKAMEAGGVTKRLLQEGAMYWYSPIYSELAGRTAERVQKRWNEAIAAAVAMDAAEGELPEYIRLPLNATLSLPLRLIPPGVFVMGSPESEAGRGTDEKRHLVVISKPIYMGVTEVTYRQFEALTGTSRTNNDADRPYGGIGALSMATFLNRANASGSGRYLRVRLPTEAEWEYAARAGTTTAYHWGDASSSYFGYANISGTTQSVGGRKSNAWGLYDMAGNVSEYCSEVYMGNYADGLAVDPKGTPIPSNVPSGSTLEVVVRGGDYRSSISETRSAARGKVSAGTTSFSAGMRIACDVVGPIPPLVVFREPPRYRPANFVPGSGSSMTSPAGTGASTAIPAVGSSPQYFPDSRDTEAHRLLAEWATQRGGYVYIRTNRGYYRSTSQSADLSGYAPYQVLKVSFSSRAARLTSAELRYVAAHRWLKELSLSYQALTPEVLSAIGDMAGLTDLSLERSAVGDADLQSIGRLASLTKLNLNECPLTDAGMQHLSGMTNLTELRLARTRVGDAGVAAIAKLSNLTFLDLQGCPVTDSGARSLGQMTKMSWLTLGGTQVADAGMTEIGRIKSLTSLNVTDCPVSDAGAGALSGLTRLETLVLDRTRITDGGLAALPVSLNSLYLNGCAVTGSGFASWKVPKLEKLYLDDTKVNDGAFAALVLPQGTRLSLRRCPVTDGVVINLSKLKSLEYLNAEGTQLTPAAVQRLQSTLPNARIYQ